MWKGILLTSLGVIALCAQANEPLYSGKITFVGSVVERGCLFDVTPPLQPQIYCGSGKNKEIIFLNITPNNKHTIKGSRASIYYQTESSLVTVYHR